MIGVCHCFCNRQRRQIVKFQLWPSMCSKKLVKMRTHWICSWTRLTTTSIRIFWGRVILLSPDLWDLRKVSIFYSGRAGLKPNWIIGSKLEIISTSVSWSRACTMVSVSMRLTVKILIMLYIFGFRSLNTVMITGKKCLCSRGSHSRLSSRWKVQICPKRFTKECRLISILVQTMRSKLLVDWCQVIQELAG